MTKNAMFILRVAYCNVAITECLTGNDIFSELFKVEETWFVYIGFWDNASWRTLKDDFRTWE